MLLCPSSIIYNETSVVPNRIRKIVPYTPFPNQRYLTAAMLYWVYSQSHDVYQLVLIQSFLSSNDLCPISLNSYPYCWKIDNGFLQLTYMERRVPTSYASTSSFNAINGQVITAFSVIEGETPIAKIRTFSNDIIWAGLNYYNWALFMPLLAYYCLMYLTSPQIVMSLDLIGDESTVLLFKLMLKKYIRGMQHNINLYTPQPFEAENEVYLWSRGARWMVARDKKFYLQYAPFPNINLWINTPILNY